MSYSTIPLSYVYMSPRTLNRYDAMRLATDWPKRFVLTQVGHCFGQRFLEYYQFAAEIDATARGYEQHQGDHFDRLCDWKDLPPYSAGRPDFGRSPLYDMPPVDTTLERQRFNGFKMSDRNSVVLHLACLIEREPTYVVMSKLITWYYDTYWEPNYVEQLVAANQRTISPDLSDFEKEELT